MTPTNDLKGGAEVERSMVRRNGRLISHDNPAKESRNAVDEKASPPTLFITAKSTFRINTSN